MGVKHTGKGKAMVMLVLSFIRKITTTKQLGHTFLPGTKKLLGIASVIYTDAAVEFFFSFYEAPHLIKELYAF